MEKLRYNRVFKKGMTAIVFCLFLFGLTVALFTVSHIQYRYLVENMKPVDAMVTDIERKIHRGMPDEQIIYISYEIDGKVYNRKLGTDTGISVSAGIAAHYSVGDKIEILYNPDNPGVIASPRSLIVSSIFLILAFAVLCMVIFALFYMIKNSKKYLVTQEEYRQEGEELKQNKKIQAENRRQSHPVRTMIGKIIKIVLLSLLGIVILLIIWGFILLALGY